MKISYIFIFSALWLVACKNNTATDIPIEDTTVITNHPLYVEAMESAHKKKEFLKKESICFNLELQFGKSKSVQKIFTTPNSSAIRVEKKDGTVTVVNNGRIFTNAEQEKWPNEQFGVYTYQYFFMLPYKLSDEGTKWTKLENITMDGTSYECAELSFTDGTGDAPDDWYTVHPNPETNLIDIVGYIVTGGSRTVEEAEKNAHAIMYKKYQITDGVPISRQWEFYEYNKSDGISDKIGEATLKNVIFMDNIDNTYATDDLVEIK